VKQSHHLVRHRLLGRRNRHPALPLKWQLMTQVKQKLCLLRTRRTRSMLSLSLKRHCYSFWCS